MFVNDRRDNWSELLPFVMHAYRTSVHESTGYSPFREHDVAPRLQHGCVMPWKLPTTTFGIPYIERLPGGSGYMMSRPLIVRPPMMLLGPQDWRQQSHCVLVQWLSGQVFILVRLLLLHQWMFLLEITRTHNTLILTFASNWTTPLI